MSERQNSCVHDENIRGLENLQHRKTQNIRDSGKTRGKLDPDEVEGGLGGFQLASVCLLGILGN